MFCDHLLNRPIPFSWNHCRSRLKLQCRRFGCDGWWWRFEEIKIFNDQTPRHDRNEQIDLHIRMSVDDGWIELSFDKNHLLFALSLRLTIAWTCRSLEVNRSLYILGRPIAEIEWCQVDVVWFSFFTPSGSRRLRRRRNRKRNGRIDKYSLRQNGYQLEHFGEKSLRKTTIVPSGEESKKESVDDDDGCFSFRLSRTTTKRKMNVRWTCSSWK